jgi:hypothetical protein
MLVALSTVEGLTAESIYFFLFLNVLDHHDYTLPGYGELDYQ